MPSRRSSSRQRMVGAGVALLPLATVLFAFGSQPAVADVLIAPAPTDWTANAVVPQYDPANGPLGGITFGLTGTLRGSIGVESLDAAPSSVNLGVTANIGVAAPQAGTVVSVTPSIGAGANLAAFDGTIDYAGLSGRTFSGLTASQTATASYVAGQGGPSIPFAPFVGTGTVALPVTATAQANVSGPLNLAARFQSAAGAAVSVTYTGAAPGQGGSSSSGMFDVGGIVALGWFGASHTPLQTVVLPDQTSSWTRGVSLLRFNPALGSLLSADFTFQGDFTAGLSVHNTGPQMAAFDATQAVKFYLKKPDLTVLDSDQGSLSTSGSLAALASKASSGIGGTSDQFSDELASDLALFTGSGSITLLADAIGSLLADVPGNSELLSTGLAGATITLSYSYLPSATFAASAVPEPGGLGLLGVALAGLGLVRRQRG